MAGRASAQAALDTRRSILEETADLASVEGLDTISIGRLASALGMSKSGVIGQFGSKENLQLAVVEYVQQRFTELVWAPVAHHEPGLVRLRALCRSWVHYAVNPPYPGGCAMEQMIFDFDGRPGPVRDLLAGGTARWRKTLRREISTAIDAGDLPQDLDPDQAAFALKAIASGITPSHQMEAGAPIHTWALTAMNAVLGLPPQG
ncbi:TetR/AcrR family transcriptional regulator [Nocardioides sp. NPDC087217]|uniref:TetR/AcrR family transcriptional regulator n=1 Tax=Nocardioides sp. NPDC087217 TaxID=3364335 RepID=UPI0037F1B67D